MSTNTRTSAALDILKRVFNDQPELLNIVTLGDVESEAILKGMQNASGFFATHVNLYMVGRTGAGKTSMGNILFGQEVMKSTGFMDCTDYVGLLRLQSNLWYFDTPGAGSNENYENITRAALTLNLLEDNPITHFKVADFTGAGRMGNSVVGTEESEVTPEDWAMQYKEAFAPDIILYTVAPHMQFLRDDRAYLRALLQVHSDKVVTALNIWFRNGIQVTTPQNIEDAKKQIGQVYATLFPDGRIKPRFVEINALTGAGINEITEQICQLVPQEKLGNIQSVLKDELKVFAQKERERRFQHTINRIAARLALYTVDQKVGNEDLINVAAAGIAQYTVNTFKDMKLIEEIRNELDKLVEQQISEIKVQRIQPIIQTDVQTRQRDILERVPIIKDVEVEDTVKQTVQNTVVKHVQKNLFERMGVRLEGGLDHIEAFFRGSSKQEQNKISQRTRENLYKRIESTEPEEIEIPITHLIQKVEGYTTKVVETINEVIDITKTEVGKKSLEGGLPVIEFLVSLGLGIKQFCLANPANSGLHAFVEEQQQEVLLVLAPYQSHLEQLIQRGGPGEQEIIEVLDTRIGANT